MKYTKTMNVQPTIKEVNQFQNECKGKVKNCIVTAELLTFGIHKTWTIEVETESI